MTALPVDQATDLRRMMAKEGWVAPHGSAIGAARADAATVIAVVSGKGGVGKTSIAVNMAVHWSEHGRRVVLIDADLGTANVDVLMRLNARHDLSHVIRGERTIEEVAVRASERLSVITGASGIAGIADLDPAGQQRLLDGLARIERDADVILLDCGAGISQSVLAFAQAAHRAVLVTTPEPTAIADVYSLVKVLSRTPVTPPMNLVVNCANTAAEGLSIAERIGSVAARFLKVAVDDSGHILRDDNLPLSIRQRVPLVAAAPRSPAARGVAALAERLLSGDTSPPRAPGFFRRLFGHFY